MTEEDVFHEALAQPTPEERAGYLSRACAGNPGLRASVEALLQANVGASGFLARSSVAYDPTSERRPSATDGREPETTVHRPLPEDPGTVIGPYKLLQQIGEGGMGAVFLAEQTHPVQRKVALKLIRAGMDSSQVIARFEAERQALALMDHPNIARVLDAGTTESGLPYFVMELIKGVPITRYCDEHHLTCRERLGLFVQVCQAVQHAHQKGVIHRDIKPSNVMVCLYDGQPVPKVIDFGVAKATGQRLTDKTLFTTFGSVVGTLEYMSPEQAEVNQLDVDTRSDVYSLGVLLYELLTGTTPLERKRFKEVALLEVLRLIREEEPPRPSTRLSTTEGLPTIAANRGLEAKRLGGVVRGELDWIVMKTLEKDRARRYETASAFAADVERYLADEPVQACPPSAWYRFRKFARRNRRAVAGVALLGAVLLAAVVGLTVSNRLIDREREQTEAANKRLNANLWLAMETLDKVYLKVGEWSPRDPERRKEYLELVGQVLHFYEQFAAQHGTDPQVRVNLAYYHLKFGNLLVAGGDRDKAADHYRRALDIQTQVVADCPGVLAHEDRLAFAHFHLADLLTLLGQTGEAAEHYGRGFGIVERQVSESSSRYGGRGPVVAAYYRCLAWNRATCPDPRFRDPARAVEAAKKAHELAPSAVDWKYMGIAHYRAGDWRAAVAALEKTIPSGGEMTELFLAMAHWRLGKKELARRGYDQASQRKPDASEGFPVREDALRAEAAALFGIDGEAKTQDGTGAPPKP